MVGIWSPRRKPLPWLAQRKNCSAPTPSTQAKQKPSSTPSSRGTTSAPGTPSSGTRHRHCTRRRRHRFRSEDLATEWANFPQRPTPAGNARRRLRNRRSIRRATPPPLTPVHCELSIPLKRLFGGDGPTRVGRAGEGSHGVVGAHGPNLRKRWPHRQSGEVVVRSIERLLGTRSAPHARRHCLR
jgi:hypothetical protein